MRLTSALTLCKSFVKLRWAANRRHHKKQKTIEDWMSTTLKKKNPPSITADDWAWLDLVMTPHYMKKIVSNLVAGRDYTFQLTALSEESIEFSVWRLHYEEDPCESGEAPADDADGDGDEDAMEQGVDGSEAGGDHLVAIEEGDAVPKGNFFFQASTSPDEPQVLHETARAEPFLYRHIRKVKLMKQGDYYVVTCSCATCDAECSPCTHMFLIIGYVAKGLKLSELPWHPRTTK